MEKIIKKLFFGASAIVLTALALAPIAALSDSSAYATDRSSKFSVTVNPTLTLDPVVAPTALNFSTAALQTSKFSVKVTSNKNYLIQLSATQPALVSSSNSAHTIPASNNPSSTHSGWGIKKYDASGIEENGYTAITTTPTTFYTGKLNGSSVTKETVFTYGIGVASGQPAGTYSTTVTVTATTAN